MNTAAANDYYQKSILENTNEVSWNWRCKALVIFKTYIALQFKGLQSVSYTKVAAMSRE